MITTCWRFGGLDSNQKNTCQLRKYSGSSSTSGSDLEEPGPAGVLQYTIHGRGPYKINTFTNLAISFLAN